MTGAAAPPGGGRLTFEAHQTLRRPAEAVVSPDGRRVAWSLPAATCVDPEVGALAELWVADGDRAPRHVTGGAAVSTLPRWGPDSATLAFASDRGHRGRLSPWILAPDGGPALELAGIDGSVEELSWSNDGQRLLVLAADLGSDRAGSFQATRINEHGAAEDDPRVFRPRRFFRRLFLLDLDGGAAEVGPPGETVWEADWDGVSLAALIVSQDPSESGWFRPTLLIWDLAGAAAVSRYESGLQIAVPRLEPGGGGVAFVEALASDRGDVAGLPMYAPIEPGTLRPAPLPAVADVSWLRWVGEGRLLYTAWRGLGTACGFLTTSGALEELWAGPATVGSRLCARVDADEQARRLVAVVEAANAPPEVMSLDVSGARRWEPLTSFNARLTEFDLPIWEERSWTSDDGVAVGGLLVLPGFVAPSKLPLVVLVHGGPTTSWTHAWISDIPRLPLLWAAAGYAVLLPNPRGSRGYGQEFARANVGDLGGRDLADIVAGIDALVAEGVVDAARVGITGNSYGGFIAAIAVGKTDRFAASIPMAVISNWLSYHNTSNSGAFDQIFLDTDPYWPGGAYHVCSPVVYAPNVTTPTLIIQGELDLCTPVGQAQELYQAIAEQGRAEVELVILPREGHAYAEREHQREIWRRSRAWFDRHLAGAPAR